MKFKDRLDIVNEITNSVYSDEIIINDKENITDIFENNPKAFSIIEKLILQNKNIILFCNKECDKAQLSSKFKLLLNKDKSIEVLRNVQENLNFVSASKIIVPEPSVSDIVKIFEYILTSTKSFIFTMNVKNFKKIFESIKIIISINLPYLSEKSIEHLIASSEPALIFFETLQNGLLSVKEIVNVTYDSDIDVNCLYKYDENDIAYISKKEQQTAISDELEEVLKNNENIINSEPVISVSDENIEDKSADYVEIPEYKTEKKPVILTNKVNKYKLLKMKLKNKNSL